MLAIALQDQRGQGFPILLIPDAEGLTLDDLPTPLKDAQIVPPGGQVTLFPTAVISSVEVSGQELVGLKSGTWAQSGPTITITQTGHLRGAGQAVHLEFTSGGGPDGVYQIAAVTGVDTFTVTAVARTRGAVQPDHPGTRSGGPARAAVGRLRHLPRLHRLHPPDR